MSHLPILAAILALAVASGDALASASPQQQLVPRDRESVPQVRVSLDQAVTLARRQVPGQVVGAETRGRRGRIVHEVKILTDGGTVRVVRVDAETGRVF